MKRVARQIEIAKREDVPHSLGKARRDEFSRNQ
jgi:hypothetical protein